MINVQLIGQNGKVVKVNDGGELQIAQGSYDLASFNELDIVDTGYTFYEPFGNNNFVITGFLIYGDKQVNSNTNATVTIYEASERGSTTVDRTIVQVEVGQNQSIPFPNIRILTSYGTYINAKTTDDDIHMTIFGHYVGLSEELRDIT